VIAVDRSRNGAERRLVLVVGAVVFVDTMFYAAITPLLPELAHSFHLSKLSAGLMTAAYPLGMLFASIGGGVLAVRIGPKRTVYTGLALLAGSTLAFGFVDSPVLLDAARFVEGVGGACSWAGGLAWIVAEAAPDRRGALIGSALGAAIAGALLGPVIGTVATAIGRGPAFSLVVLLALALMLAAAPLPAVHTRSGQGLGDLWRSLGDRVVVAGIWLVALPAIASGLLNVLGPLRLHELGAAAVAIGVTFLAGAAIEAALSPVIGRVSDRRGRLLPLRFGLAGAAVLLALFALPRSAAALALVIVATATTLGAFWAPAMALLSDAAEVRGLDQALAAALMNVAWAGGQILGSGVGGAIAKVAGDALPMLLASALCVATLALLRGRRHAYAGAPRRYGIPE
jgi:MFS family permease